jgi:hypothetical protein
MYDSKPIIGRVAVISTFHATPRDLLLLATRQIHGITVFAYAEGIVIPFLQWECETWEERNGLLSKGVSEDFLMLIMWAKSKNFDVLRLDRDGPVLRELNQYEHQ